MEHLCFNRIDVLHYSDTMLENIIHILYYNFICDYNICYIPYIIFSYDGLIKISNQDHTHFIQFNLI